MLFTYDVRANADNWIHTSIISLIRTALVEIDANRNYNAWPEMLPAGSRTRLETRTSLRDRTLTFLEAYKSLDVHQRQLVKTAMDDQNDLQALFQNTKRCLTLAELPQPIQGPVLDLFTAAFNLLTPLKLRDQQYKKIYKKMVDMVCPFCGCEPLDPPGLKRNDLDHYLAKTIYPFAAVNLNNLAPMGDRCNKSYKKSQDMLTTSGGLPRKCADPFRGPTATVSLSRSTPFKRKKGILPSWRIDLEIDDEEVRTWESVFSIRRRWSKAVLDQEYLGWLREFGRWSKGSWIPANLKSSIPELLDLYIDSSIPEKFSDRSFLKRAVFAMLRSKCSDPEYSADIQDYLRDIVEAP